MEGREVGTVDARGKARVQTVNDEPSMTVQSDAPRADIREILRKYKQVGIVDHLSQVEARFMDVSGVTDFADAMRLQREAEGEFMRLPSKVREVFGHDVARWLDAAHDGVSEEQKARLIALGILDPDEVIEVEVPPAPVEPVPE